jgi:antagonist of KipI
VVTVDLPLMAQLAPGDWMRFAKIGLAEAHGILKTQHRQLGLLRQGVAAKMRSA